MSEDFGPANRQLVQKLAGAHYAVATSHDPAIAIYDGPVYRSTHRALIAGIRKVYGMTDLKARRVYDIIVDSGESVAYCVRYVNENRESRAYSR